MSAQITKSIPVPTFDATFVARYAAIARAERAGTTSVDHARKNLTPGSPQWNGARARVLPLLAAASAYFTDNEGVSIVDVWNATLAYAHEHGAVLDIATMANLPLSWTIDARYVGVTRAKATGRPAGSRSRAGLAADERARAAMRAERADRERNAQGGRALPGRPSA